MRAAVFSGGKCHVPGRVCVRIDETQFPAKPDKDRDVPGITARLKKARFMMWSIGRLAGALSTGCTVCPADFNGESRKLEDWRAQQVWCVDVDNDEACLAKCGRTLREADAVERAEFNGLPLVIAYQTFNGTAAAHADARAEGESAQAERYRLLFARDELVTDRSEAEAFGELLLRVFPEADPSSVQLNRMFYGTDKEVDVIHGLKEQGGVGRRGAGA